MLQIAVAGSSRYSRQMAAALANSDDFQIDWVLTPQAKTIGRRQILSANPLAKWAQENKVESVFVEKKIDESIKNKLLSKKIDLLLVVDFGYLVPNWLLDLPTIAPLNIHPSKLPLWRGSSPGQFALLWQDLNRPYQGQLIGGQNSSVTLMVMNAKLDQGNIIKQFDFKIEPNWTQSEYYDQAFNIMAEKLAQHLIAFAQGKITSTPQALVSPGPVAKRLNKADSFIAWEKLKSLMAGEKITDQGHEGLLEDLLLGQGCLGDYPLTQEEQVKLVANASRAFSPWPGLWTLAQTQQGQKRMKILTAQAQLKETTWQLTLATVQIEGKTACNFKDLKQFLKI